MSEKKEVTTENQGSLFEDNNQKKKEVTTEKSKENEHPKLGKILTVSVHPTADRNKKSSIHASIGRYSYDFLPGKKIKLPEKIVELLEESGRTVGYFDPDAESANGNKGAHLTKIEPHYIVKVFRDK